MALLKTPLLTYGIALVWLINGLLCKVLNLAPRHQKIVSSILGQSHALLFTKAIGFCEILMSVWILSRLNARLNAAVQIGIIATMNLLEFILVPELLLWGRANLVFAALFCVLIYYNAFTFPKKPVRAA